MQRHRRHSIALVLALGVAAGLGGCSNLGPSFDLDEDPDDLDEFDRKSDEDPCADFAGGELSGDDPLVLVNKDERRQLAKSWSPRDLVALGADEMMPGRSGSVRYEVSFGLSDMFAAAAEDGLALGVRSGYRSFRTQCITFAFKVREHGLDHARRFSAEPGRSQHQLGTTVDISSARLGWGLEQSMGETAEGQWLAAHAHEFGFALSYPKDSESITGYGYEPWHYRYIGLAAALERHASGLILEQYLHACATGNGGLTCPREQLRGPEPNEGWIGGACTTDVDCADIDDDAFCLTDEADGYPGGTCTMPCLAGCPDRVGLNAITFCASMPEDGAGLCHSQCSTDLYAETGCRDGYECVVATRPSSARSADVCMPR